MELIKDKDQLYENKIAILPHYGDGICHECNSPVEYSSEIWVVEIKNTEKWIIFVPLTQLRCPWCDCPINSMLIWKNLDVTEELVKLEKDK